MQSISQYFIVMCNIACKQVHVWVIHKSYATRRQWTIKQEWLGEWHELNEASESKLALISVNVLIAIYYFCFNWFKWSTIGQWEQEKWENIYNVIWSVQWITNLLTSLVFTNMSTWSQRKTESEWKYMYLQLQVESYFPPSTAQKNCFSFIWQNLSQSFYLNFTKQKYWKSQKGPNYLEKNVFSNNVNKPERCHNHLNGWFCRGEFWQQTLILELVYHVIWYCLYHAFVLLSLATLPVLVSFSSMWQWDRKRVAVWCFSQEILIHCHWC